MSDVDITEDVEIMTSMFNNNNHTICCFDTHTTLCGLQGTHDVSWEDIPVKGADCKVCEALYETKFCPHGMECDTWIDIRDGNNPT